MIHGGNKVSTTPGTRVRLSATHETFSWLTIQPICDPATGLPVNTSPVVIGDKNVAFNKGLVLQNGDFGVTWTIGDLNWDDLYEVYMDVITSGDGVQFIYGQR